MSFPRYPKYKDSGSDWLGEVPDHWEVWKLAHAFTMIGSGTTPKTDRQEYYEQGDIPWINTGDLNDGELEDCGKRITAIALADHSSLKLYPAGSLLIAMYGATIGRLAMLGFPATVNQACCVFAGMSPIVSKFMFYWFLGLRQQILSLATGGGQPNVSQDILRTLRVGCPEKIEQTAIAAFLDRETAKIDELVAEQQRLIELLKEKRQAVISHAVTKGLNPHAPMKPSGVEWLGDVPEHWEVTRLRNLFREVAEPGIDELPVLSVSIRTGVSDTELEDEELDRKVTRSDDRTKYKRVAPGDLVYNMMRAWQGGFGTVVVEGMVSPAYVVARPRKPLSTTYIENLLRTPQAIEQMRRHSRGVTDFRLRLYWDEFKNITIALPPHAEAIAICEHIKSMDESFNAISVISQESIDLLQERRTALISAAVTGKIDVRGLVETEAA